MASTVFDSALFRDMFGTEAMRAVFDDRALVARYVEVEVALARAESRVGVIPSDAGAAIARAAAGVQLDFDRLKRETDNVGYPILPVVAQLSALCGDAGRYIHWGATTQDIMDTATVLQMRAGLDLVAADVEALRGILAALAKKHRDTPMAGRTHLQQALPVTFGYKAAIWLAALDRHAERLAQLRPRVEVVEFAGAAGTLASIGAQGLEVQRALAEALHLGVPAATWHVARDGFAEVVNALALITGSLGKVAFDIMLMMATEFGEAFEPFVHGRGASSTMPQKRNPISSELILAASKIVRQQAGLMLDGMVTDFERATGPWHAEWAAIPQAFLATSSALHQSKFMLGGLIVDAARMRRNLDITSGLIVAEAVMMGLAPKMGRQIAHDVVYESCRLAAERGISLLDALVQSAEVTKHLDRAALVELCDPANYLGLAPQMVDRVVSGRA
jgi:3-carboxy-cis,cis-muconate cycloisomerase